MNRAIQKKKVKPLVITKETDAKRKSKICGHVLYNLRQWFGIKSQRKGYKAQVKELHMWTAKRGRRVVGFYAVLIGDNNVAEIIVCGVMLKHRNYGVGTAMLADIELWLEAVGVNKMIVKTLSSRSESLAYAKTRAFYESRGFELESLDDSVWEGQPCATYYKHLA